MDIMDSKDRRDLKRHNDKKHRRFNKCKYRDLRGYRGNGHKRRRMMVQGQKMSEDLYVETRYYARGGGRNYWDCGKEVLVMMKRTL